MKRIILVLFLTGLYYRPSFLLLGQMDWVNVLSKGYFVGSFNSFFAQGYLDESFYFVMRFTLGGLVGGLLVAMMMGNKGQKSAKGKKKKN